MSATPSSGWRHLGHDVIAMFGDAQVASRRILSLLKARPHLSWSRYSTSDPRAFFSLPHGAPATRKGGRPKAGRVGELRQAKADVICGHLIPMEVSEVAVVAGLTETRSHEKVSS